MFFLILSLFSAGIVVVDQLTKFLTVANIGLFQNVPFLPGIVQLTYVQNTGAAWSMFQGMQWLFAAVFVIFTVLIVLEYLCHRYDRNRVHYLPGVQCC